jgi:hypothetical protein
MTIPAIIPMTTAKIAIAAHGEDGPPGSRASSARTLVAVSMSKASE